MVEERYTRANGYEADCDVIYGDTDSVMVHFRVRDIARAMELGREAAQYVSQTFVRPIKLEFEKVRSHCHSASREAAQCCLQDVQHRALPQQNPPVCRCTSPTC
jgi:hypothetical protein